MINNQYNQPLYGMPYANQGGMPYANQGVVYGAQPQIKRTNPLTSEEISSLRTKTPFSLAITQDDVYRGICFHVDENGNPATVTDPNGATTCTICGETWNSNELTADEVKAATDNILSVLQTIKLMYLTFPEQAARDFYQIIPLLKKVPQLYKIAADNFRTFEGHTNDYYNGQPNPFALFGQLTGGNGFGNAFQYQQTQPGFGQPTPPMNPPVYTAPNPFDATSYGAQPAAYSPVTPTGYAYAPGQASAPVAPGQPVAPAAPPAQPAAGSTTSEVTSKGNHTP